MNGVRRSAAEQLWTSFQLQFTEDILIGNLTQCALEVLTCDLAVVCSLEKRSSHGSAVNRHLCSSPSTSIHQNCDVLSDHEQDSTPAHLHAFSSSYQCTLRPHQSLLTVQRMRDGADSVSEESSAALRMSCMRLLLYVAEQGGVDVLRSLLQFCEQHRFNALGVCSESMIMLAAARNKTRHVCNMVRMLCCECALRCDACCSQMRNLSALHIAAARAEDNADVLCALIQASQHGFVGMFSARDDDGLTPLDYINRCGDDAVRRRVYGVLQQASTAKHGSDSGNTVPAAA